jgi:hypothetical protein
VQVQGVQAGPVKNGWYWWNGSVFPRDQLYDRFLKLQFINTPFPVSRRSNSKIYDLNNSCGDAHSDCEHAFPAITHSYPFVGRSYLVGFAQQARKQGLRTQLFTSGSVSFDTSRPDQWHGYYQMGSSFVWQHKYYNTAQQASNNGYYSGTSQNFGVRNEVRNEGIK